MSTSGSGEHPLNSPQIPTQRFTSWQYCAFAIFGSRNLIPFVYVWVIRWISEGPLSFSLFCFRFLSGLHWLIVLPFPNPCLSNPALANGWWRTPCCLCFPSSHSPFSGNTTSISFRETPLLFLHHLMKGTNSTGIEPWQIWLSQGWSHDLKKVTGTCSLNCYCQLLGMTFSLKWNCWASVAEAWNSQNILTW